MEEDQLDMTNVEVREKVGEGGYGTVQRVTFKKPYKGYKEAAAKNVRVLEKEEVEIMRKLHHPNIVIFIAFCNSGLTNAIFLEYAKNGSLHDYLKDKTRDLPEDLFRKWAEESALALEYLHENSYLHRDIKTQNALLFEDNVLKLCDFGLAKEIDHSSTLSSAKGSYEYMAPEILRTNDQNKATYSRFTDVFAYGRMLLAISKRQSPFHNIEYGYVVYNVGRGALKPDIPSSCPKDLAELMRKCWDVHARRRPTMSFIVKELSKTRQANIMVSSNSHETPKKEKVVDSIPREKLQRENAVSGNSISKQSSKVNHGVGDASQQVNREYRSAAEAKQGLLRNCKRQGLTIYGDDDFLVNTSFFYAVSHQLTLLGRPPQSAAQLRASVVQFLSSHQTVQGSDGIIDFSTVQPDWDSYLKSLMSQDDEWVDTIIIVAVAYMLKSNILIVTSSPPGTDEPSYHWLCVDSATKDETPVRIGHVWEYQFRSLDQSDLTNEECLPPDIRSSSATPYIAACDLLLSTDMFPVQVAVPGPRLPFTTPIPDMRPHQPHRSISRHRIPSPPDCPSQKPQRSMSVPVDMVDRPAGAQGNGETCPRRISGTFLIPESVSLDSEMGCLNTRLIEMVAKGIGTKWRSLAWKLKFTNADCDKFESDIKISTTWWPAFRMLDTFRGNLNVTQARYGKRYLAEAVSAVDRDLSLKIMQGKI